MSKIANIFDIVSEMWTGCDWNTNTGIGYLNLKGVQASELRELATRVRFGEISPSVILNRFSGTIEPVEAPELADDMLVSADWLELIERSAESARAEASQAVYHYDRGELASAFYHARRAVEIESVYHPRPDWAQLVYAMETARV
jgi:hypothetical protein